MNHVYLAGPHVFLPAPEREAHLREAEQILNRYGLCMVAPPLAQPGTPPEAVAKANLVLLEDCDGVIADLSPFRGAEPDSGTVFELAYAVGRRMPALGYSIETRPYAEIVRERGQESGRHPLVEEHDYPINLMLVPHYRDSLEACAKMLASILVAGRSNSPDKPLHAVGA